MPQTLKTTENKGSLKICIFSKGLEKMLNKTKINVQFGLETAQSNTSWFCLNADLCKIK